MEKLKCYLVDDEISAIENMQAMLAKHCPEAEVIGFSNAVDKAVAFLSVQQPDILFLDIRMQHETGFDLMRLLPEFDGSLIFVTAHDEYGLQAIKFSATDYLLKPINVNELIAAIQKVRKKKKSNPHTGADNHVDPIIRKSTKEPAKENSAGRCRRNKVCEYSRHYFL